MKKITPISFFIVIIIFSTFCFLIYRHFSFPKSIINVDQSDNLEKELIKTKSRYALLIQSQAIDEFPVWSQDGENIYVNEEGDWKKIDLSKIKLDAGVWRNNIPIGVNKNESSISHSPITQNELDSLLNFTPHDPRDLLLPDGTRIKLELDGLSTLMKITLPGKEETTEWSSDFENCHSIVLSPNSKYIIFKCELNGVILMKI
jgi:hypothetical protein